ncbi:MAG: NAD-dependent epimerase/dehydratase family protein [Puniceicoccaceae bacterium]
MSRILITGICGFVGSTLAGRLIESGHTVLGIDNLIRPGSARNRADLIRQSISVTHGDIRNPSDLHTIPQVDWVIDAAANASVIAGVDGRTSSQQLVEHNLLGTINLLEYCKAHQAGFILLSTSRVYSIKPLAGLALTHDSGSGRNRLSPDPSSQTPPLPSGLTNLGIREGFSTSPPISLYGATKLASEQLALEYGDAFQFPVWINRCGVMAGAGQFAQPAQGIFAFWIHSFREGRPLKYIGFGGHGHQVRDCLHPSDLLPVIKKQLVEPLETVKPRISNFSGGLENSASLAELSSWCKSRFPDSTTSVSSSPESRSYDLPWVVLDSTQADRVWDWRPVTKIHSVCEELASFADSHPDWLKTTSN